jgi:chemotaxis signal transduction protein
MTTAGYVLFRLGSQSFATDLDEVREIVRLGDIDRLPGTQPPLAGVVVLRGAPLPVLDVRAVPDGVDGSDRGGDLLVLSAGEDTVGVAVDQVVSVLAPDELTEAGPPPSTLPAYVVSVGRLDGSPVLVVDMRRLLDLTADGWTEALTATG